MPAMSGCASCNPVDELEATRDIERNAADVIGIAVDGARTGDVRGAHAAAHITGLRGVVDVDGDQRSGGESSGIGRGEREEGRRRPVQGSPRHTFAAGAVGGASGGGAR